jgi:hypothetical protein
MKGNWRSAPSIALGVAISTSCALLTPATVETQKEMLTKIPDALPEGKVHPATLLVFPQRAEGYRLGLGRPEHLPQRVVPENEMVPQCRSGMNDYQGN